MAAEPLDVRAAAQRAIQAGLRVVPPKEDGTKRPETERVSRIRLIDLLGEEAAASICNDNDHGFTWKHWSVEPPTREQLRAWFGPKHGLGILTGSASGNVELFEFDDRVTFDDFLEAAVGAGLHELTSRIMDGYLEETPGGGVHWLYRCDELDGNEKLARYKAINPETGKEEIHPLIETRGEGGYAVLAPSHGPVHLTGKPYRLLAGGVESIVTITPDERRLLFQLARTFDRLPKEEFRGSHEPQPGGVASRPGDDFNARATWEEILEPHGWRKIHQRGDITRWRRPEKDIGVSATTNWQGSDLLYVFSTSTPFEAERGYSKWRAYAILNHAGDFKAAARELARQGYGQQRPNLTVVPPRGGGESNPTTPHVLRYPLTDSGNAERLVELHGDDLRYCKLWGKWLVWDGMRWHADDTAEVERRALLTARSIAAEAVADEKLGRDTFHDCMKWAKGSESGTKQAAMVKLAGREARVVVIPDQLDRDGSKLGTQNGVIDTREGEFGEHEREALMTRVAGTAYREDAACPTFLAFLDQITFDPERNQPRPELVSYLQRAVGYSLTGDTSERVMFILHGVGKNGKSTFIDIIREMMGDYAMRVPTDTLMARRNESIPNDIARLKGARFVFASETDDGKRLSEALIKDLTGGDTISARFMRGEWFDFKPEFKLWLATNHRPTIRGTDPAIWDRIHLIPFDVRISEEQQDRNLSKKLRKELPGILRWAVEGCLEWQRDGLKPPVCVRSATNQYRTEMDRLAPFLADCCAIEPYARVTAKELYAAYQHWCNENGERYARQRDFGVKLGEKGFEQHRGAKGLRFWVGLRLVTQPQQVTLGDADSSMNAIANPTYTGKPETASPSVTHVTQAGFGDDDEPDF